MCILALKFVPFLRARLELSELDTLQKINSRKGVEFSADYILIFDLLYMILKFNVEKNDYIHDCFFKFSRQRTIQLYSWNHL